MVTSAYSIQHLIHRFVRSSSYALVQEQEARSQDYGGGVMSTLIVDARAKDRQTQNDPCQLLNTLFDPQSP